MKFIFAIFLLALAAGGCTTKSRSRAAAQNAFLAGQNAALRQQMASQFSGVTVTGPVQNPQVPWVAGLTLAQAVATANYLGAAEPRNIILTRQGESAKMGAQILLDGPDVPLEPGDAIELRQ